MKNIKFTLLCTALSLWLALCLFSLESAWGAIQDPAIVFIADSHAKNYQKTREDAAGAYAGGLGKCGIDRARLPYCTYDFKNEEERKLFEQPFSVKAPDLPLLALVERKEGTPSRLIIRIEKVKNLSLSFFKIMKIFRGEQPPGMAKKDAAPVRWEKDGSTMVLISRGAFFMGAYYGQGQKDEYPLHEVEAVDFYMDTCEVTNGQFQGFVKETGYTAKGGWEKYAHEGTMSHPVVSVTWHDAMAYAKWAGKRLPTEEEWEKAARGDTLRIYPWGNNWDPGLCNNLKMAAAELEQLLSPLFEGRGTFPVGSIPAGASPYSVMDMAGNAEEWTASSYQGYRGNTFPNADYGDRLKVARGGSWKGDTPRYFGTANRGGTYPPTRAMNTLGFRCAKNSR